MTPEKRPPVRNKDQEPRPQGRVMRWLDERFASGGIPKLQVETTPLSEIGGGWQNDGQRLINPHPETGDPRFFTVEAHTVFRDGKKAGDQPGLIEVADPSDPAGAVGTVGLLVDHASGNVLLQVGAEPFQATPGEIPEAYVTLRPSLQGSYTNLAENRVPLSEHVDPLTYVHFTHANPNRIRGRVRYGITEVDAANVDLADLPNHHWFSVEEIDHALLEGAPMNQFLTTALNLHKARLAVNQDR